MLKKLLKYDFLDTYKPFVNIISTMIVIALVAAAFDATQILLSQRYVKPEDSFIQDLFSKPAVSHNITLLSIVLGLVVILILAARNIYQGLFSEKSELKRALPATNAQLITSSVMISMFWINITLLVIIFIFILRSSEPGMSGLGFVPVRSGIVDACLQLYLLDPGKVSKIILLRIVDINICIFWIMQTTALACALSRFYSGGKKGLLASLSVMNVIAFHSLQALAIISLSKIMPYSYTIFINTCKDWTSFHPFGYYGNITFQILALIFSLISYLITVSLLEKRNVI